MNINILKQISLLSIFLGAALGVITVVPFVGEIAFWTLMCLSAPLVLCFMIFIHVLEIKDVKESVILGSVAGFVSFIGFSLFYIPLVIILAKFFQIYPNYGVSVSLSNASLGMIIILVIFMGILNATVNAFSGFLTYYGIDMYKMLSKKEEKFEVKDNDGV